MKNKSIFIITFSFLFFTANLLAQKDIVCIGNSISQGKTNRNEGYHSGTSIGDSLVEMSYRFWLWEKLDSMGLNINFVGGHNKYFNQGTTTLTSTSRYTGHTFPPNHECYYGITPSEFIVGGWNNSGYTLPDFDSRLQNDYTADVAIIHIGTNGNDSTTAQKALDIRTIISKLRNDNPTITVLLSTLVTGWKQINDSIPLLSDELTCDSSVVFLVDNTTGFINNTMTFDWVHPKYTGQIFMAERFFNAYITTMSADIEAPSQPDNFVVTNITVNSADLSWNASNDNMGVNVYKILLNGIEVAQTTHTSFSISDIDLSGSYTLSVVAVDFQRNESIPAIYSSYVLNVGNGTGDGSYFEGEEVVIIADTPPVGQIFDAWIGDITNIADVNAASTTFTMGTANATVTATYKNYISPTTYTVSVTGGLGSGAYEKGELVTITADSPLQGEVFHEWTGSTSYLSNPSKQSIGFIMPGENLDFTATYSNIIINVNESSSLGINIYPNPTSSFITISNIPNANSIQIVNSSGQIVRKMNFNSKSIQIDLTGISKGLNTLKINLDNGKTINRLLIIE